jgi:hypothetical protein
MPTFADRGCHMVSTADPEPLLFLPSSPSIVLMKAEWTPFQTHYFSENLVVPGIEPRTSGSVAMNSDH